MRERDILLAPIEKPSPQERPFAVFDIEAAPQYPGEPLNTAFHAAGFFDGDSYKEFYSLADLFEHMMQPKYEGWSIYAHNGSGYDFIFLLEEIVRQRLGFVAHKTGGRFFITILGRDLLDSMVILRGSLDDAAKSLQVKTQKGKVPDDFFERIKHYWASIGREYMRSDVLCLHECISVLRQACRTLGCNLKSTLASTALDLFQRRYLRRPIRALPWWHSIEEYARLAYVGGRTEIFKREMKRGASWDINSSYPYAMLSDVPTDFEAMGMGSHIPEQGIVYGKFHIPQDEHIPPLHLRTEDKLYFPTGTLEGWYTSAEARYCLDRYGSSSVEISQFVSYKPEPIFREYVTDLYARRAEAKHKGNAALAEACKYLMNTLYGKMGTNRVRQQIVCGPEWYHYPWNDPKAMAKIQRHDGWKHLNKQSLLCYEYSREHYIYGIPKFIEHGPYILPAIAATITAAGRLALQRHLNASGQNAVYCDTDSVYRETSNPDSCFVGETGSALGKLKLENIIRKGYFALPKCYDVEIEKPDGTIEHKGAAKGLPRKNMQDVIRYVRGEAVEIKRMQGAMETLRLTGEIKPTSETMTKRIVNSVHKRHPSGRAFSVDEIRALGL
jgi:hypothetical protein